VTAPAIALFGGIDPSGGAGLAADLHACVAFGARGLPIACARTAQGDGRFEAAWISDADEVAATTAAAVRGLRVAAIKTGMVGATAHLAAIGQLARDSRAPLVADPVAWSSSCGWLWPGAEPEIVRAALMRDLLPLAAVVTPNWHELGWLAGRPDAADLAEAIDQARRLPCPVLIKTGHADDARRGSDVLWTGDVARPLPPRVPWPAAPRGTGCRLAAAVAAGLAAGASLYDACAAAAAWLDLWARAHAPSPIRRFGRISASLRGVRSLRRP